MRLRVAFSLPPRIPLSRCSRATQRRTPSRRRTSCPVQRLRRTSDRSFQSPIARSPLAEHWLHSAATLRRYLASSSNQMMLLSHTRHLTTTHSKPGICLPSRALTPERPATRFFPYAPSPPETCLQPVPQHDTLHWSTPAHLPRKSVS